MQKNTTTNTFENKNLDNFIPKICDVIIEACQSFWEKDIKAHVLALNDFEALRNEKLVYSVDFFTSQIKVENHKPVVIRLAREFIENILDSILKSKGEKFDLTKLTELEVRILNAFCELLYKKLDEILVDTKNIKTNEKNIKNINFVFLINDNEKNISKIVLSIPSERINFEPLKKIVAFNDTDFLQISTEVKLNLGSSKITFNELNTLIKGDIIVLENSSANKMTLTSGDYEKTFSTKIKDSLIKKIEDIEIEDNDNENITQNFNEVTMDKNVWDDIQIEINAEFEKVKMTLGELKQISQGQIVDLGSILENEISLFVEDKKVAKGELIIINDRYGVRLNEIYNSKPQSAPKPISSPQAQNSAQKPQATAASAAAQRAQTAAPRAQGVQGTQGASAARPIPRPQAAQKPQANPASAPPRTQAAPPRPKQEEEEFDYSDFEK